MKLDKRRSSSQSRLRLASRPSGPPIRKDVGTPESSHTLTFAENCAVAQPPMSWKTSEALCTHVLRNEQAVTASINELYATAESAKDRPAVVLLQWFVNEQMEEEAAARAILGRIRLGGASGVGLLMIDQELAKGTVPGMPAAGAAN